jgi:cytochrome c oxidase subunit II
MHARRALAASLSLGGLLLLSGAAVAQITQGRLEPFEAPASPVQRGINDLYYLILPIALVIGVLLEVAIVYIMVRYRAKPGKVELHETEERGHTRLEIAWTIPPAVILLIVGLLSTQTLTAIENPGAPDFTVKVIGSQWVWNFEYPDNTTSTSKLSVEANRIVGLELHATDVIHDFAVPSLGIKIDAIPGRVNHYFLRADQTGMFLGQCQEYCGGAHGYMRAEVEILPTGSTEHGWASTPTMGIQNCAQATNVSRTIPVRMLESGGSPWSIDPRTLSLSPEEEVCLSVQNPTGQNAPHNLTFEDGSGAKVASYDQTLLSGREGAIVHKFPPGSYTYFCAVPGHRQLGMQGTLTVA